MVKKAGLGIFIAAVLIFGAYYLTVNWSREVNESEEMTVTSLGYGDLSEDLQRSIDEEIENHEESGAAAVKRFPIIQGVTEGRNVIGTRYEVFIPEEGERVEILEIQENDGDDHMMTVIYEFVEDPGEGQDGQEEMLILRIDNYVEGRFRAFHAEDDR
jgi:hypothetical protein